MYYRFNVLYQALNKGQQRTDKSVT
jgi:hypothetical protein